MFISELTCSEHMLGFVLSLTVIYYTLLDPYVLLVSISCGSGDFIILSSFLSYILLINIIYFSHGL